MDLEDYEAWVEESWTGPKDKSFAAIGFGGEAGEVLNEVKKELRDGEDRSILIRDELGDSLHYLIRLASLYGYSLSEIAKFNVKKCKERRKNGTKATIPVSNVAGKDVAHS